MAFNIVGRPGSTPAIFGDEADMKLMTKVNIDRVTGSVTLELANPNPRKRPQQVPVTGALANIIAQAKNVITVAVDRFGETAKAELISLDPLTYGVRHALGQAELDKTVSGLMTGGSMTVETVVHRAGLRRFKR
ncbi:MAG: hypothetical protein KI792_12075 [Alphaproteobacteria bacterium]|nr:hypothetical protein [Alphaproteobacteria bacterium SS10]